MLLTICTTHEPATDLGYLLHKDTAKVQAFNLWFGKVHVFYPEARKDCCTAAVLLDVDPVGLVRGQRRNLADSALERYVNDRPYVASSFLSVTIARIFNTALSGRCKERPELVKTPIPLEATLAVVPCRGGDAMVRRIFEPLGYEVDTVRHPLDEKFDQWGEGPYHTLKLHKWCTLKELLNHLYVLVPVMDDNKHYWVGEEEVQKLLRKGKGWLHEHPAREQITDRYLRHRRSLSPVRQ